MIDYPPSAHDDVGQQEYGPEKAAFAERFAAELTAAGMQRMAARVFSCLLVSDDHALGSAQLAERLQVSPAAVSGAVRYLSQVHMVSRERLPGSRRELYRLHHDVWYEAMANQDAVVSRWLTTLRGGIDVVGEDSPAGRRLAETAEFMAFMRGELEGILERWRRSRGTAGGPGA